MSFPRYPKYKDSGVEWLGLVPEHWETPPLYLRYNAVLGKMLDERRLTRTHLLPYLRNVDVQWDRVNVDELPELDIAPDEIERFTLKLGDILICEGGEVGRTAIWGAELEQCAFQKAIHRLRPLSDREHTRFFFYCMSFAASTGVFLAEGNPNTIPHLTGEKLRRYRFPTPSHIEQLRIASFLDQEAAKIDELVVEQRRLIELLKEKRQAVISHAVTKGLNPNVALRPSDIEWLGDVPEHWEVKRIRHFADVMRGKFTHRPRNDPAYYDGEFPFVQTGDITGASRYITEFKQTLNDRGVAVSKQFPKGTLVMTIAANIGDVAILDFPAYFPDSIVGLVPRSGVELMFLYYLMIGLKQPMLMTATVSTQMNLNVDQISSLPAACPPRDEQTLIVSHLDEELQKMERLNAEAERAVELLQERRTALISAAVTGKIDVRNFAPQISEVA